MDTQKFIKAIPMESRGQVLRALEFATQKHAGQKRPGGESPMEHIIRVATIAAQYAKANKVSPALIVAALLHDVIEDTSATFDEIEEQFGEEVAKIVQAVSHEYEEEPDEIYLQRVARGGKLAVLVKRFDRLDNLATLSNTPQEFHKQKIKEIEEALPVWQEIDPEGAKQIENMLNDFRYDKKYK